MKHKKLGKNFSKFYLMGPKVPRLEKDGEYTTCPNGIFIKMCDWDYDGEKPPLEQSSSKLCSPFELELLRIKFVMHMRDAKDIHTSENNPFSKYF